MSALGNTACSVGAGPSTDGKVLYQATCARCHGPDGKGDPVERVRLGVPDMTSAAWQEQHPLAGIPAVIRKGSANGKMPGFGDAFRQEQLDALSRYVKSLGPITAP